jgi:hypothetical protein
MKHKVKRIIQKLGIYLVKKFHHAGREKLSKTEIEASILFRKLISDPKTDLLISPISSKYYLRNDDRKLLVVLGNMNISIINHIFGYDVSIPSYLQENLKSIFNDEVENRRQKMEEEYRNNVRHNLQQVIKSLKDEK